jgi:hypothetical protein
MKAKGYAAACVVLMEYILLRWENSYGGGNSKAKVSARQMHRQLFTEETYWS